MYVSSLILKIKRFENQIGNVFWSKILKLTEPIQDIQAKATYA
jgi:hypothetical protein